MRRIIYPGVLVIVLMSLISMRFEIPVSHGAVQSKVNRQEAIQQLRDSLSGRGHLKTNRATGLVDFVRLERNVRGSLVVSNGAGNTEKALAFLRQQASALGLQDPETELRFERQQPDFTGAIHLTFRQVYQDVPVFGGLMRTHFDSAGDLRVANGTIIPDITLNPMPSQSSEQAAAVALAKVHSDKPQASALTIKASKLYVYRTGLAQGIPGENHLVWEIEISNNSDVREFVYIDAHSGKFVDQMTGVYDNLNRRVYDGENIPAYPPPNYPANPFWAEGQPFPTGVADADAIVATTQETYNLFRSGFGRDSFDGAGASMQSIFNSGSLPGNAQWNGQLTNIGPGFAVDDVIAHEWTHAYTQYTDNLVYAWQPGALNEAYSDIFGETIDLLNGHGLDTPGGTRQNGDCVTPQPTLRVNSPASVQGDYVAAPAIFGPALTPTGVTANIVLVDDGVGTGTPPNPSRTDGCQTPFRNAAEVRGNIALIDRTQIGTCTYAEKVKNAQQNGAIAVIVANDVTAGDIPTPMLGTDNTITIPAILIGYSDGQALRARRLRTVNATLLGDQTPGYTTYRWLIGEESPVSAQRDMWNPRCYGHPGKTSDQEYFCRTFDQGGVHENSGVPNHAYALLVDGGNYNGQTIQPVGFTKAAHIYFRAMSVYQTPTSDFADHAEALEASTSDLIGANLPDLMTGLPSGQVITPLDLEQVQNAALAVELRNPPSQCGFHPLLAKDPPDDTCPDGITQTTLFNADFESDPTGQWITSKDVGNPAAFIPRDWTWVHQLPDGRSGSGFFAIDPQDDCSSAQIGVLHLDSPEISLPRVLVSGPHVSFDHWVATEAGNDGGQLMISVNGGPFKLIPSSAFIYNSYNTVLFPSIPGYESLFNPRAGQPAFSGSDAPAVKGSWGTSIVDLTTYAHSGDRIKLRWDLSTDFCFGTSSGWYLDNVRVYACRP